VLKDTTRSGLRPGDVIAGEREGGEVQYPNGGIAEYLRPGQGVLEARGRYLLFLKAFDNEETLEIWTGYEFADGKAVALDHFGGDPSPYEGLLEEALIEQVRRAIDDPSGSSRSH
jgi:hypothetical protein